MDFKLTNYDIARIYSWAETMTTLASHRGLALTFGLTTMTDTDLDQDVKFGEKRRYYSACLQIYQGRIKEDTLVKIWTRSFYEYVSIIEMMNEVEAEINTYPVKQ